MVVHCGDQRKYAAPARADVVQRMYFVVAVAALEIAALFAAALREIARGDADEAREEAELMAWVRSLPEPVSGEMEALYREMIALETPEAKLYKAMDKLEAIVQHNESDIATWEPHEYQLNMTYADDAVAWSPVLRELREAIRNDTKAKIAAAEQQA